MQVEKFSEALPLLKQIHDFNNSYTSVLWNLGIATAALGNHNDSVKYWNEYLTLDNNDWHVYAKLIQSYQALNMPKERDATRSNLLDLYKSNKELFKDKKEFCIEQLSINNKKVLVYETFEPGGEFMIFYTFYFLNPDGTTEYKYSLGSYESTTQISRELGEIAPNERVYHLDWYQQGAHKTMGFFNKVPEYEQLKKFVIKSEAKGNAS